MIVSRTPVGPITQDDRFTHPSVPETAAPAVLKSNRAGFELPPGYIYSDWKPVAAPLPEGVEPDDLLIPDFLRRGE